jgi:hypothetical protein
MNIQMDKQSAQSIEIACRYQLECLLKNGFDLKQAQPTSHIANLLELYNRAENKLHGNHADYDVTRVPYWLKSSHAR